MRRIPLMILLSFTLLAITVFAVDRWNDSRALRVTMRNAREHHMGSITLYPLQGHATLVTITVRGLTPGFHGFHIHEHGHCEVTAEGEFVTAGGHYDTSGSHHGQHSGDMPTLLADARGNAILSFSTRNFDLTELTANDGTAIIIHADADNFANIPERYGSPDATTLANGDSGARIACGIVSRE
jgi:superoxide dismutase, Cu-Zn family